MKGCRRDERIREFRDRVDDIVSEGNHPKQCTENYHAADIESRRGAGVGTLLRKDKALSFPDARSFTMSGGCLQLPTILEIGSYRAQPSRV